MDQETRIVELEMRLAELERRVEMLERQSSFAVPQNNMSASQIDLTDLLRRGNKIEAIKMYREATGCGLREAKEYVDALDKQLKGR
jgi:ribosomal protein L7/L12